MRRLKRSCALILALCLLWTCVPTPALATKYAADIVYALLYRDGTLVFQRSKTPDASRGTVTNTYEVDLKGGRLGSGYIVDSDVPWYNERESIVTVDFVDVMAPVSTNYWFGGLHNLTQIRNLRRLDTSRATKMGFMFDECSSLTELDVSGFDTSNATNMFKMFGGCSGLTELDVSGFDTSNVTTMGQMFYGCSGLTELDVSGFDTSHVTNMSFMFGRCSGLTELDASGFNTSNVTDMKYMFSECSDLMSLNVSGWDTSNVTDTQYMFWDCPSLLTIYASEKFVTDNVKSAESMFDNCKALRGGNGTAYNSGKTNAEYARIDSANAPGYFTRAGAKPAASAPQTSNTPQVSNTAYALLYNNGTLVFQRSKTPDASRGSVSKTYTVDLTKSYSEEDTPWGDDNPWSFHAKTVDFADTISPVSTAYWFYGFDELTQFLHPERLDTSRVTDMSGMFYGCESLKELDLSSFNTSKVTDMSCMFGHSLLMLQGSDDGNSLQTLNLSGWDTSKVTDMTGMFEGCGKLESLDLSSWDTSKVTDMSSMFADCSALTTIYTGRFDTSKVTDMSSMFRGCESFTALDLSGFDTSNVTGMFHMFDNCNKLTELNVSGFDTSSVTNMDAMFLNCESLTALDLSGFDTSNVTSMVSMFSNCFNLTELNVSGFDTSSVTDMYRMFYDCENLKTLDVSGFDTSGVTGMQGMFDRCESLTALDVRSFDTSNVTDMSWMFAFCAALTELDLSGFDTSNVNFMSWMFAGDAKLTTIYASDKFVTSALKTFRYGDEEDYDEDSYWVKYGKENERLFFGDEALVGGDGTRYDAHFDKNVEYARIDSSGAPGYFTRPGAAPASPKPVPRYVSRVLVNDKPLPLTNPESRDYLANGNFVTHTQGTQGAYTFRVLDQYGKEFTNLKWTLDSPDANASVSGSTLAVSPQARMSERYTLHASGPEVSVNMALFVIPDMTGKVDINPNLVMLATYEWDEEVLQKDYANTSVEMQDLLAAASDTAGIDAARLIAEGKLTADNLRVSVTMVMELQSFAYDGDEQEMNIYPTYKITTASGKEVQAEQKLEGFGTRKITVTYDTPELLEPVWVLHVFPDGGKEYVPVRPVEGREHVYSWEQNGYGVVKLQGHIGLRGLLVSAGGEARDGPSYTITVVDTSGGIVFASVSKARSSAQITLTAIENSGYRLGAIQVKMAGSVAVSVSGSGLTRTFTMPRGNVTVTATFVITDANAPANPAPELRVAPTAAPSWINVKEQTPGATPGPSTDKKSPFSDVPVNATLFVEIVWADNRGVMKGYRDGTFDPGKAVSSITAVVVLGRLDDSTLKNASTGLWYKPYETWANKKGLLKASTQSEESIALRDTVFSRGSMALLLTRYLKSRGRNVTPAAKVTFQDANQMRPGEEAAFQYLYGIGIFKGTSSNRMSPRGHLTRAQLAALLYRLNGML